MAEVMEQVPEQTAARAPEQAAPSGGGGKPKMSKKKKRRIRRIIALVLAAAVVIGVVRFRKKDGGGSTEVIRDVVSYGAITATVEGSGLTKAKNSESISITTAGTVQDVFVTEGQVVTAGTPLFVIDSDDARSAVQQAEKDVEGYQKQLNTLNKDIAGLNLAPGYPGKLMDVADLNPGDTISKGQKVATLSDDTRLRLTQYYSYAYEGQIKAGQSVDVSIPALMTTLTGKVEAVHMVSRITPEGSRLFSADILIDNPGSLTADMAASATLSIGGETVYPYESGKLEYYRTGDLCSTVSGTVISSSLVDYLQVSAGQVLVRIDGEDSESEIFSVEQSLEKAQEELENARKNLANCSAVAPIDGTVIGLTIQPGQEVAANTTVITISDTSSILINATVDERHISYVKAGTMVDLNQWGNAAMGTVESVSLSSTVTNGVAMYPMVISADNYDGMIQVNSNVQYSLVASQNENCLVLPIQCVRNASLEDGTAVNVVYVEGDRPDNALDNVMVNEEIPEDFWPVQVEIGISDNYYVEIKSGVEEGTTVFTQFQTSEAWG